MFADRHPLPRLSQPALWRMLKRWHRNARTRADLRALDAHLRADVGVSADDARVEGAKGFWQR